MKITDKIVTPFADFIREIENIRYVVIQDDKALYPYSAFSTMIKKFITDHIPVIDAKQELRNFFKSADPDLKQDYSNSIRQQIDSILEGLERLSGEPDKAELVSFLHKLRKYLVELKTDLPYTPKADYDVKDYALAWTYLSAYGYEKLTSKNKFLIAEQMREMFNCDDINANTVYDRYRQFKRQPEGDLYKIDLDANRKTDNAKLDRLRRVVKLIDHDKAKRKAHEHYSECKYQFEMKYMP